MEPPTPTQGPSPEMAVVQNELKHINEFLGRLETKIDGFQSLTGTVMVMQKDISEAQKWITETEDKNKWLGRTAWGGIILGIIGLLFALFK